MSLKFPFFSSFNELFSNNTENIQDENTLVLKVYLRNTNESLLRFFQFTTLTIGYINNRFKRMRETGSFIIIVNSHSKGPTGIYAVSRSDKSKQGSVKEIICSNGLNDETIELTWDPYEYPLLKFKTKLDNYKNQSSINFYVSVISTF
jgi:hypothetical protein